MSRSTIRILVAALALPLAACNVVVSQKPWFTASPGDPRLSPGLWVALQNGACSFSPTAKLETWPDCAKPFFVRGTELLGAPEARQGEPPLDPAVFSDLGKWQGSTPVMVAGNPLVMQLRSDVMQNGAPAGDGFYLYLAMQPQVRDGDGTIRAVRIWPVFCGPPPPPPARGETQSIEDIGNSGVSRRPFPGLHKAKVGCEADSAAAIRRAAALSEDVAVANEMPPFSAKWLRATLVP